MRTLFKSSKIFTNEKFVDGYLAVIDGVIDEITQVVKDDDIIVDYQDNMIVPGFIDTHNHGFAGWSMTDEIEEKEVHGFAKAMTSVGVTMVLPTAKPEAFAAVAKAMDNNTEGAKIFGIHSEGPFWARGGENTTDENYPEPSIEETKRLIDLADNKLKFMAIAPERENAYEVIRYLNDNNIKVAICHTRSTASQIFDTLEKVKIDAVTHLGNGMQGIHHRDVGTLGATLLSPNLYYEIITDLNHLSSEMLQIMFKLQPYEKFIMISDSNYMAGLPIGVYERYGKNVEMFKDGLILNEDGRILGSGTNILFNIKQLVEKVGVSIEKAIMMSSTIPSRFLEVDDTVGTLERNKLADFTIINDQYECLATYVNGSKQYDINDNVDLFNPEAMKRKIS